ncbi:RNasePH-like protein [Leishmania major strain Friedlin]|uniref:RNasePH-like protein n=1 Tax=Leishmania major TaxID=5664 RepID=Q4QCR0_LEIMA|nr:RNasePH-like protein [Leishmania major strain Friedlin]CAG9573210.1 RNasePH-like_protein [Leishmania major strain Friedlin]CAJ04310.1 RNasePH-like protein [Leishmania major strain Friedlin]|eukprot:XP_001682888.1 RNasePH-like protein [Leishmania major strain Friedlin]
MSVGTAAISLAEVRAVQDGVANDVREDGRTLLQRRPVHITARTSPSSLATAAAGDAQESYDGSYVEVNASGTVVLAAATPSVVDGCATAGPNSSAGTEHERTSDTGRGKLHITIDAVPHVLDTYASAVGGRNVGRYRRDYLAFLASTMRQVFGAAQVEVQEQQGVAEADVVQEEAGEATVGACTASSSSSPSAGASWAAPAAGCSGDHMLNGFPAADLYVGEDFGFMIHVDVHVLQSSGGNLFTAIAYAIHAVLRSLRLPAVTLHKAPGDGAGVSVEVDRSKPYRQAVSWTHMPLLCVLLVSPTGHCVVDPTLREEWAMPQQVHVAAGANGQVMYFRYQQLPSRRGNAYQLRPAELSSATDGCASYVAPPSALSVNDCWSILCDAVHICQAMLHDCEEALTHGEGA